jgi:hypothetical protein
MIDQLFFRKVEIIKARDRKNEKPNVRIRYGMAKNQAILSI